MHTALTFKFYGFIQLIPEPEAAFILCDPGIRHKVTRFKV